MAAEWAKRVVKKPNRFVGCSCFERPFDELKSALC